MLAKNSIRQPVKNDLKHFVDKKNLHYDTSFSNKTKICDFPISDSNVTGRATQKVKVKQTQKKR